VPNATATADIGAALREARSSLGISVEEAAWRTRIRPEYLRALEAGRFAALGPTGFVHAHLRTYARFLGLDAGALLAAYVDRHGEALPSAVERLHERERAATRPRKPRWLAAALASTAVLVAAAVSGVVRGPGPRGPATTLPDLPPPVARSGAAVAAPTPPRVTVLVTLTGRSWLRVLVDGTVAFEGSLGAGDSRTFVGRERVEVALGNAGVVRLAVDGRELGSPGRGAWRGAFSPQGASPGQ
jgi:cytoskeleton protein RodZ